MKRTAAGFKPIDCFTHFYQQGNAAKSGVQESASCEKVQLTLSDSFGAFWYCDQLINQFIFYTRLQNSIYKDQARL